MDLTTTRIYKHQLPKEFAEKWIAALESGDYQQGKNFLMSYSMNGGEPKYCCLGVACHVIGISNDDMNEKPLPYHLNTDKKLELPDLLLSKPVVGNILPLIQILAILNDGHLSSNTDINEIESQGHVLQYLPNGETKIVYGFSEIAQFIRDNVELI